MKIIGEKINGTLPRVGAAVEARDKRFIEDLAVRQARAGASWIDVNAGALPEREPDDLCWLVRVVQEKVDIPLCLDSSSSEALGAAAAEAARPALVNSVSAEDISLAGILPLVVENGCRVIALAMDDSGLPRGLEPRMAAIRKIIRATREAGMRDSDVFVDPLVTALATDTDSGLTALETISAAKAEFPDIHFTMGLSNLSFGLPDRPVVNRVFLCLALAAGLDTAIMDPLDKDLARALAAARMVLGQDPHCLDYIRLCRSGRS